MQDINYTFRDFIPFGKLECIKLNDKKNPMSHYDWLMHRQLGLGGSDQGTIMGMNHRFSPVELFYQKLGLNFEAEDDGNEYTFWGHIHEANIIRVGQYIDFETQEYRDRYNRDEKLREHFNLPLMVRNPEYPWLLANIDGAENWNKSFTRPRIDAIAEGKTISRQAREVWEGGLPPYYIPQAMMYGTVLEPIMRGSIRTNIFILEDSAKYSAIPLDVEKNPALENIRQSMLHKSYDFHERIELGKAIVAKFPDWQKNLTQRDDMFHMLEKVEPPVDANPAYEDFFSDFYKEKMELLKREVDGDMDMWELAMRYQKVHGQIVELTKMKQELINKIKNGLKNKGAYAVKFGKAGKISFNKRFYCNVDPDYQNEDI